MIIACGFCLRIFTYGIYDDNWLGEYFCNICPYDMQDSYLDVPLIIEYK
jgi:hypothetical protein